MTTRPQGPALGAAGLSRSRASPTEGSIEPTHYGRVAVALHWLIGVALLGQIAFGFLLDELAPRATPARTAVINLHKSVGIVLGLAIVARLAWRLGHRPPAWPRALPDWQRRAATVVHRALYACMVVMPLSGYVGSNFSKHGVRFFGVSLPAWGPDLPGVYSFFNGLHVAAAWLFALLIAGHIAAALKHALVERDGIMARIWPRTSA
ncbi:MAG: cytochrome b [Caldimonas sp.]